MSRSGGSASSESVARALALDVRRDLALKPKRMQPRYLYDGLGSALFEAITHLPWYRITRAERDLLARLGSRLVSGLEGPLTIVELGCGSGDKTARIAGAVPARLRPLQVHLIDVSPLALELSGAALGRLDDVTVVGHCATYEEGLRLALAGRVPGGSVLVLFLGSNLGNFEPTAAHALLARVRGVLQPGDALLLGADLVKPEAELLLAYDDPLGVTAAFDKNLLVRMNAELEADFDLSAFDHRAVWNAGESRVEMHLVSRRAQEVRIPRAEVTVQFAEGEFVWTESSYKFRTEDLLARCRAAGFRPDDPWIDDLARFALTMLRVL